MKNQSQQKLRKLHLGCGDKYLPEYINIDARKGENVDLVCDITRLPFEEDSVDEIYMCHSLEHIEMNKISWYIEYLYKLLKRGGEMYISVPNFEALSSMYLAKKCRLLDIIRAVHGGQEYPGNLHYISFDQDLLTKVLLNAKFRRVELYKPEAYLPRNYSDTSTYRINNIKISLNMKAIK